MLFQLRCSRERSGCQRCAAEGAACSYSRAGVIRRNRKRKASNSVPGDETPGRARKWILARGPNSDHSALQLNDGSTTYERLQRLVGRDHQSLKALASLLEEYHAVWQGSSAFDRLSEDVGPEVFSFEQERARAWVDSGSSSAWVGMSMLSDALAPRLCRCCRGRDITRPFCTSGGTRTLSGVTASSDPRSSLAGNIL